MKKFFGGIAAYIRQTDRWLWLFCFGLSGMSCVLLVGIDQAEIAGIDWKQVIVQAFAAGLGTVGAIILSKFDYHTLGKLWKLHAAAAYLLVLSTFIIGQGTAERSGDKSWIAVPLPGFSLNIQPAEFLKLSFILTLAYHLYVVRRQLNAPLTMLGICIHGALPILLIHFQGDDGSALVFAAIFVCMAFAAGVSWRYILPTVVLGVLAAPLAWVFLLNDYQRHRFLSLYDPNANPMVDLYQQYNAKLAIGSGKTWGMGIFSDSHHYIPEVHNDFIFSFIGESLGFVGCLAVIAVIAALCARLLSDGRKTEDLQGRLICIGVFAMISFQAVINIGMNISLIPVIGITLPFLSYGGSSVLASYLGIGLALSVYMHTSKNLFSES